jgi:phosphoribosylglycinamide formyltransferase 1
MDLPRIAVFASGNGSNLQALIDRTRDGSLPARIVVVLSDQVEAFALERARRGGIEALHLDRKSYASRGDYDNALLSAVNERKIDWVVLAGFMRILTPIFVRPLLGRVVNIHPALLPRYPGTHSIQRAFEAGEREVGVTVHFVDEGVDTGPVIRQESLVVREGESLEALTERVHRLEHRMYPEVVSDLVTGKVRFSRASG